MAKSYVEKLVEDPENLRVFLQERSILEVTELLESIMKEEGVTRSALARRLGKSRGWVTQLLDGEANKTIRTIADAFAVLGREYRSFAQTIQVSRTSKQKEIADDYCTFTTMTKQFDPEERCILSMNSSTSAIQASDESAKSA